MSDRLPPHSTDAEAGVIGCMLLDPSACIPAVVESLGEAEAFYDLRHQELFHAMRGMIDAGRPVDPITLPQSLKEAGKLDRAGGLAYLSTLTSNVHSAANLGYWLGIVAEKYALRRMIAAATECIMHIREHEDEAEAALAWCEQRVMDARRKGVNRRDRRDIKDLVVEVVAQLEREHSNPDALTGLSTGLVDLDKATLGLQPGEMTVIAAFPSIGKSALAANIAEHVAIEGKAAVGIFTLEMNAVSVVRRVLQSRARTSTRNAHQLAERDFHKLTAASIDIKRTKLMVDDASGLTISEVRARARRMHNQHALSLIVVDYLQLLSAEADSREQEVATISRGLKQMATELGCHVFALSQLNDSGKLRESRAIGQDADGIWKLTKGEDENDDTPTTRRVYLDIEKQRSGLAGVRVALTFLKPCTRFECVERNEVNP